MSAVAETEMVSTPQATTLFAAYREDLRLVKFPRYPKHGPGGRQVGEDPGEAIQFRSGILIVPEGGELVLEDGRPIDADEALAWLRKHPLLGNSFEGFWEVSRAAPPVSQDELSAMMRAAWDEDALAGLIRQEEQGWQREALLVPAREALERLLEAKAEIAAQAAAVPAAEPEPKPAARRAAK